MLPRHYQEEVFNRAQKENIIAALDTGAGKTFIGLLLLKWVAVLKPGSKVVFLVPKVTLVEQQGTFVASHSSLRVMKLHGALDIDLADRKGWLNKFECHDVFIMTAQIFLNLITHSLWSIDRVALLIFDECHHTRKNHPYNGIMREYFEVSPVLRPKIFGMTASPIWNVKDAAGSLAALEANMDCKVVSVCDHADELSAHAPKPLEVQLYISSPTLWMCLGFFKETFYDLNISWDDIERRYMATLVNLGPYCASLYLYFEVTQRINRFMTENILDNIGKHLPPDICQIQNILAEYDFVFNCSPKTSPVCLEWCSPKIRVLVDVLISHNSPTFQGIIFVEQRQIAVCLARVLPCIPALSGLIRCAELVGHGDSAEISFRDGAINLLIATAVAEEGLDFPACDLVVRFDALQHMVGYVQSRGRARSKASTFVIMVEENNVAQLARYQAFLEKDPELKAIYQSRQDDGMDVDDEEEDVNPIDLAERERYVVASTGAVLTYDNAINLLARLCALIPYDPFTPPHVPRYSGEFQATLRLPSSLPLSPEDLRFVGPPKLSKKEAKSSVAFIAVKRLHQLDVFDQYLLPVSSARKGGEDTDGKPLLDVSQVPNILTVSVKDPWTTEASRQLWIHPIFVGDRCVAGIVTGTDLPPVEFQAEHSRVHTASGQLVRFDEHQEFEQREMMHQFTREGIWYRLNGSPITLPLSLYVVPITVQRQPDFPAIQRLVVAPRGNFTNCGNLLVMNVNLIGRTYLLKGIRHDLSPSSVPPEGSPEAGFRTYHDYWTDKWTRKAGKRPAQVPLDGPLLEVSRFPRSSCSGEYSLKSNTPKITPTVNPQLHVLFPQGCCRWISISQDIVDALDVLPALCHRITDIYRVHRARLALSLPPIENNILVEALTLPCSAAGYSNQRLETLGDAVLQLCTTVYLFNRYPNRHEGQLSIMRQNCVSNRFLLSRAKEIGLEAFLTSETQSQRTWRYTSALLDDNRPLTRCVSRQFPRRSLQDCMEATLGASFVTGGIEMSLHTGQALGLDFGGPIPWCIRYRVPERSPVSSMFSALEEALGYSFRSGKLLVEALTHPSFDNQSTNSYERLEFLGDAILDLVVIDYLYRKFPDSTSDQLAWPRTRAICAPALAFVGVQCLKLHQLMLMNNVELSMEVERYVPHLQACSGEEIIKRGWRYDPPKALSDVFESVIGAVLVDSNYNYERIASVVELVMQEVLSPLTPSLRRDPISELFEWAAGAGKSTTQQTGRTGVTVFVHDVVVAGPIVSASAVVAKNLAAERALSVLMDLAAENNLQRLCNCTKAPEIATSDHRRMRAVTRWVFCRLEGSSRRPRKAQIVLYEPTLRRSWDTFCTPQVESPAHAGGVRGKGESDSGCVRLQAEVEHKRPAADEPTRKGSCAQFEQRARSSRFGEQDVCKTQTPSRPAAPHGIRHQHPSPTNRVTSAR
ncbi:hypothetical protein B0H10DRAFT_2359801 [Mycena sp. CBHHK59/15]|nr:hypothetical protein B0H10DRAFT_2359801 [Mycena sp. CBHHK59/15]